MQDSSLENVEPSASDPAKLTRFKQSQASNIRPALNDKESTSSPPEQPVLLDHVMEREAPKTAAPARAPDLDSYDPEMQQRQLATEYYRLRNSMIRQQGGFKRSEDDGDSDEELVEEREDGKVKKVSRFRAARMR